MRKIDEAKKSNILFILKHSGYHKYKIIFSVLFSVLSSILKLSLYFLLYHIIVELTSKTPNNK